MRDEWQDTGRRPVRGAMLPELFEKQAALTPRAVAVEHGPNRLTYARLAMAANKVAARLRHAGAARGTLVAVFAERSAEIVAGFLGTAATGAAYVALDPGYPADWIEMVLRDSGAAVILAQPDLADRLPAHDARLVPLNIASACSAPVDPAPVDPASVRAAAGPEDPAYVLYTSGSTGRPKGVVVPHGALTNFLFAMRDLLGSTASDAWLAATTPSFDISGLEMYLPLITGGRVVVAPPGSTADGVALADLIARAAVTHVQLTPSGWQILLDGGFADRRVTALVGGEALLPPHARAIRARVGRLWNMYGPTETTIWSTAWEVPERPDRIGIGVPIANTSVHVMNVMGDRFEPVAPGTPGELLIGGHGVAHGYLGRPGLTAQRFVPDPYGPAGGRLYRTGDTVRELPDGTLEFLGRSDDQVKLRGHRIELGEIESVLAAQPGVRQAAVAVRGQRLIAYVVGEADRAAVASAVANALPAHMVPSVFVPMDALPLSPNGKLNRKALPAPETSAGPAGRRPAGPTEELLVALVSDVLGMPDVGVEDSFLGLGGDSVAAMTLVRRGREAGLLLTAKDVVAEDSVAALAAVARPAADHATDPAGDPAGDSTSHADPAGALGPLSPAEIDDVESELQSF